MCGLLSGCYSYVPEPTPPGPEAGTVRLYLNGAGVQELQRLSEIGALDQAGSVVEGEVVGVDGTHLTLRLPAVAAPPDVPEPRFGQDVRLPLQDIVQTERRTLNGTATGLVLGVGIGGLGALLYHVLSDARRPDPGPLDPGDDDESRIPLIRITLP